MQVLFTVPDFVSKYVDQASLYMNRCGVDPSGHLAAQMSKLGHGLLSGDYSKETSSVLTTTTTSDESEANDALPPPKGIKPTSFKSLIGRNHAEFSTKRQQDAHEFITHLFEQIERSVRTECASGGGKTSSSVANPIDAFRFRVEDRIECTATSHVKYKYRDEFCLSLPIAMNAVCNRAELDDYQRKQREYESMKIAMEPNEQVRITTRHQHIFLFHYRIIICVFVV